MAKLVLAAGVPHPPRLVREIADAPGQLRAEALMKQARQYVEKASPDIIIELDSDHFVNFFYDNMPAFCVGLAEEAEGPQEIWCPMPRYVVRGHAPFAKGLLRYGLKSSFDLAAAEELRLDHSVTALYRTDQLRGHIRRALDNGVTKDEIGEVITHMAFYAGWPTAANAVRLAKEVFEEG